VYLDIYAKYKAPCFKHQTHTQVNNDGHLAGEQAYSNRETVHQGLKVKYGEGQNTNYFISGNKTTRFGLLRGHLQVYKMLAK
jgi:hypothetical protein